MNTTQSPMLSRRESALHPSAANRTGILPAKELQKQPGTKEAPLWRQTIVVRNRQGREEAFTVGPDGYVWSFFPDAANAPGFDGYRLVSMGMPADLLTVGHDAHGSLVVIAVKGLRIRYRVEQALPEGSKPGASTIRWSAIEYAPLPSITGAVSVQRVYTQEDFGGLRVAAIVDVENSDNGSAYAMAYCQWKEEGPNAFKTIPSLLDRPMARSSAAAGLEKQQTPA